MKKLDLLNPEIVKFIGTFSDDILELIDNQDELTRSDLQGAVQAIVMTILNQGLKLRGV